MGGKVSVRNCFVRDHGGMSLAVQSSSANVSLCRFATSLGTDLEIRELRLDGIDVFAAQADGLHARLPVPSRSRSITVKKVVLSDVAVRPVLDGPRRVLPDIRIEDLSTEMSVRTIDEVFAALAKTV